MTKNPLTMIGLTPAILGLGLTQDELYEYCTRTARALFACVHPDRHHGPQRPEVLHFSEAFDLLKDRQVFNAAIKEFQGQRRHGSARTTHQGTEEETLRLRFQELQRRNAMLMGEERNSVNAFNISRKSTLFSGNPCKNTKNPTTTIEPPKAPAREGHAFKDKRIIRFCKRDMYCRRAVPGSPARHRSAVYAPVSRRARGASA